MFRMTFFATSALFGALCMASPMTSAMAAGHPDASKVPSFEDLDANHDGKLVRSEIPKDVEALKQLRAHFREADRDGNGSLSKEEYERYMTETTPSGL